jgi:hypothetical protein
MSRFIESLEGRRLLTASATSLAAELAAVNTDAGLVKADLTALQALPKADGAPVATDILPSGSPG